MSPASEASCTVTTSRLRSFVPENSAVTNAADCVTPPDETTS